MATPGVFILCVYPGGYVPGYDQIKPALVPGYPRVYTSILNQLWYPGTPEYISWKYPGTYRCTAKTIRFGAWAPQMYLV